MSYCFYLYVIMKNLEFWRSAWEEEMHLSYQHDEYIKSKKTLKLLSKYVGCSELFLRHGIHGSEYVVRFLSGRVQTQHACEVKTAITDYLQRRYPPSVLIILSQVKRQIENTSINPNGTLSAILHVIKEKTTIDYYELDPDEILTQPEDEMFTQASTISRT